MRIRSQVLSLLKLGTAPRGNSARKIISGPYRGIIMALDLQCQMQLYLGLFERELAPWLKRLANNVTTAIDIGAGAGEYALYLLLNTNAQRVLAFEPLEKERAAMKANLTLNGLEASRRVTVSGAYVGENDGAATVSLNSLQRSIAEPCLIKIDVEGEELVVLKGASALLAMRNTRWIIEVHSKNNEAACLALLSNAGFNTRTVSQAWWRAIIPERRPLEHNRWLVAWRDPA